MTKVMVDVDSFLSGKKTKLGIVLALVYALAIQLGYLERSEMIETLLGGLVGYGIYDRIDRGIKKS